MRQRKEPEVNLLHKLRITRSSTVETPFASCCIFEIEPNFAIVTDVEVSKEHRRKGHGTHLVQKVVESCGQKQLFVSSVPESEGFWKKVGCTQVDFDGLPTVIKSKLDVWGHKFYKQFVLQPSK